MRNSILKKLIVFTLAFVMVITYIPLTGNNISVAKAATGLAIYYGGEPCDSLVVDQIEKETLSAEGLGGNTKYQWQIRIKGTTDQWVNIKDMTKDQCDVSYAVIGSMLDEVGCADIRCKATVGDNEYISEPVTVTTSYDVSRQKANSSAAAESVASFSKLRSAVASTFVTPRTAEYVTITIKYVYENEDGGEGITAFEPYVASLQAGTNFSSSVPSPTIVGYDAKIKTGDSYEDAKTVELNYTNLTENQTITVRYIPALVDYKVRYYLQNVTDDLYTENTDMSKNVQGYTGDYPDENLVKANIDGFSALYYQPETIAADGSTEFQCYYDRNYYLVNFDMNGGYGVEPIYARYETPFVVNNPIKHGYVFGGWDLLDSEGNGDGVADTMPDTIPLGNRTYKAIWTAVDTTYTVVYWLEDANNAGEYNYLGCEVKEAESATTVYSTDSLKNSTNICGNTETDHTHTDACKVDRSRYEYVPAVGTEQSAIVEGDGSTVINVRYTPKTYTLRFFYARSNGTKYEVVGGTTYPFGTYNNADENTSVESLLSYVREWGQVQSVPTIKDEYKDRYITGSIKMGGYTYYYLEFSAGYGSDIGSLWPIGIFNAVKIVGTHSQCSYDEAYFSAWNGEYKVKYTQAHASRNGGNETIKGCYMYLDDTILYDSQFTDGSTVHYLGFWDNGANISWSIPKLFRYNLMVKKLDGSSEYELYKSFDTYDDSTVENQTPTNIEGLTYKKYDYRTISDGSDGFMKAYDVYFYYDRNNYALSFYNYNGMASTETLSYGKSLSNKSFEPSYPDTLEDDAYDFGGWYTTAGCYDGSEFTFDGATMPANDLTLYAKWTPKTRTVKFYNQYSDIGGTEGLLGTYEVSHGNTIVFDTALQTPSIAGRTFAGWFYMKNGEKVAFNPYEMAIRQDLNVFAEWTSSTVSEYTINYVLKDNDSNAENNVKIADKLYGMTFAGQTKTFTAKTGDELYSAYSSGYFPVTNSHSIVIDEDKTNNEYTFEYIKLEDAPYTVRYVDKQTGAELATSKHVENPQEGAQLQMVVTEKFQPITGYMPDSYYKRLVLSTNSAENVITFYYLPDTEHAPYVIHHKTENLDGTYSDYSVIQGIGDLNKEITAVPLTITGFTYDSDNPNNITKGTVDSDGLQLILYYERNTYPYTVRYLEYGSDKVLHDAGTYTDKYGKTITISAKDPADLQHRGDSEYQLMGEASKEYEIRATEADNVITFYYKLKQYTIKYEAVCTEPEATNFGRVKFNQQIVNNSGQILENLALPSEHFRFIGWYTDEECTVANKVSDSTAFKPTNAEDITYYALFEPIITSLTITKSGMDDHDSSIFNVKGIGSNNYIDMDVVITGNASKTIAYLPEGKYQVTEAITENSNWSWRYTADESVKTITVEASVSGNKVEFVNKPKSLTWLGGENIKNNKFN